MVGRLAAPFADNGLPVVVFTERVRATLLLEGPEFEGVDVWFGLLPRAVVPDARFEESGDDVFGVDMT